MTPKQTRMAAIFAGLGFLLIAATVALTALEDNIVSVSYTHLTLPTIYSV